MVIQKNGIDIRPFLLNSSTESKASMRTRKRKNKSRFRLVLKESEKETVEDEKSLQHHFCNEYGTSLRRFKTLMRSRWFPMKAGARPRPHRTPIACALASNRG